MKDSKYNSKYFQNKNNNDSNQIEKFVKTKKLAKPKTSDSKDLNNFVLSTVLRY